MEFKKGIIQYCQAGKIKKVTFTPGESAEFPGLSVSSIIETIPLGRRIRVTLNAPAPVEIRELTLEAGIALTKKHRIFCNGYQTCTDSREFKMRERMYNLVRPFRFLKLNRSGDYDFYKYSGSWGRLHGYTYTYIRNGMMFSLIGSCDESAGFTIFEYKTLSKSLSVKKECEGLVAEGECRAFDLVALEGSEYIIFESYFRLLNLSGHRAPNASGWTSWYNHHTSEETILENIEAFRKKRIPIDIFQIDDGYQKALGDWLETRDSFPRGMGFIANKIKEAGFKPGLWLAPFVCQKESTLFQEHKDWLLKNKKGKPVVAGWNRRWNGNFYALDLYHEGLREYIRSVFDTVINTWGFEIVKLDFLYAASIEPRAGKTRGTISHDAMKFLRECAGDRIILACGVPLGSAFGLAEYCRIGSDVAPEWEDWRLHLARYRERISTINSLTSTIGRRHLNGRAFLNDSDVFILSEENNKLLAEQKFTLFLLNNIFGGLVFCSDAISDYDTGTMKLYRSMFPIGEKSNLYVDEHRRVYAIKFLIDGNSYLAFSNLSKFHRKVKLPAGIFFQNIFEIQNKKKREYFIGGGSEIVLDPSETRFFLKISEKNFTVAGTTAHIFPGSEITALQVRGNEIAVSQDRLVAHENMIFIKVPDEEDYICNGRPVRSEKVFDNLCVIRSYL